MLFEAEATPNSAALIADAALVVTLAYLRIASDGGRPMLAKVGKVQFSEGKKAQASFSGGVLRIIVSPSQGLAGRPSSERVEKVLRTGK
ncbi:DUF4908 domain-containing protein [Phenylobacterium sp.]|uniref:DUF4908 domain-containing protein n=1 Tax=Phenylobacterium sp. TaxID=1871053 RepID=UPI003D2C63AD